MKILTVEQMTEVDRLSSTQCDMPSLLLMENAGLSLYRALQERFGPQLRRKRILVLCGKGNNGGDGLVLARQLLQREGLVAEIALLGKIEDVSGDAGVNLAICLKSGLQVREIVDERDWSPLAQRLPCFDILVDALLGTGLTKPLRGLYETVVAAVNATAAFVLAVDVPSGMFSDSTLGGVQTVRADLTVTFTAPKIAHVLNPDQEAIGELIVAPIGSPARLLDNPAYFLNRIEEPQTAAALPPRRIADHKGDCGHVAVLAGSRGKAGAAALASTAALRTGSGLVTALVPWPVQDLVASFRPEVMTEGLEATEGGTFASAALPQVLRFLQDKDAAGAGPGLTTHEETVGLVRELVRQADLPLVLDADGLNAFAEKTGLFQDRKTEALALTPHPGEFSRLTGRPTSEVLAGSVQLAREFARSHGLWLVLKGFRTLVAEPGGQVFACPRGNPGMASAGMGDVLTGVLTSMLGLFAAHGMTASDQVTQALTAGVYLHALAGDLAAEKLGQAALTAGDAAEFLGPAQEKLRRAAR